MGDGRRHDPQSQHQSGASGPRAARDARRADPRGEPDDVLGRARLGNIARYDTVFARTVDGNLTDCLPAPTPPSTRTPT